MQKTRNESLLQHEKHLDFYVGLQRCKKKVFVEMEININLIALSTFYVATVTTYNVLVTVI